MKVCPKCQYERQTSDTAPDYECPKCGIVYAKFDPNYMRPVYAKSDPNYVRPVPASVLKFKQDQEAAALKQRLEHEAAALKQRLEQEASEKEHQIATMCLTTTSEVPSREIDKMLDVISAQCAFGMNIIQDNLTAVSDVFGGRSKTLQNNLSAGRKTVLRELREEAFNIGADAVVGVNLVYNQFSGIAKSMVFVVATGTAVRLKPCITVPSH